MSERKYIGARYVPLFADPLQWDNTRAYEPLTIVLNNGNSYTSRQYVPIGIDIANSDYWALSADYNAAIQNIDNIIPSSEFSSANTVKDYIDGGLSTVEGEIDGLGAKLPDTDFTSTNTVKDYIDGGLSVEALASVRAFDTVADMQAAADLENGMVCHTNGFHASGDGGAAYYKVSNTGTSNGMDVLALQNNLFATLVITDAVKLTSIGATNENDISPFFNRAIGIKNGLPIIVDKGVYDIQTPINLKSTDRIIHNGFVVYRPNTVAFEINGDERDDYNPTDNNALHSLFGGDVFTIWADRNNNTGKIGMMISEDNTVTKRSFIIENCNFIGLQTGFIDSAIRSYLYEFKHCQFQYCNVCYQYGKSGLTKNDSGENILFDYCVFANSGTCVKLFADSIVTSLVNCSYDFCTNVFYDNSPNGYHVIKIIGGHFEGIGSQVHPEIPATVLYGGFDKSLINFIGSNVLISNKHKFSEGFENYGHALVVNGSTSAPRITIDSCSFTFTNALYDFSVYIGEYINCESSKNTFRQNSLYLPTAFQACTPFFDNDEIGVITTQNGNATLKFYNIQGANDSTLTIEQNTNINKNVIRFTTGSTRPYFYTKEITGVAGKQIAVNWLSDNLSVGGVAVEITFNDGTTQDITPYQHRPTTTPTNVFKFNDSSWGILRLPNNVKHIVARAVLPANATGIFGGIIVAVI